MWAIPLAELWAAESNLTAQLPRDLTVYSIEELMNIPVTSVSKKPEPWFQAPAAIYVITGEDIHRSGVTTIAEALRMAPGVQVAHTDASTWAISARGFNDVSANKLLVLIDGRSVYTPLFSGVYWDVQDTRLEDIDRIEVIRGPGATLWGANAVNGVINIITKSAKETQGALAYGGGGTEERGFGGVRYGGKLSEDAYFRAYAKYFYRDDSALPNGDDADDHWQIGRGGFRFDWNASRENLLTVQGDGYAGYLKEPVVVASLTPPSFTERFSNHIQVSGGNVLGRWTHTFSEDSDMSLQTYYDRVERENPHVLAEIHDTFDVDFQHRFSWMRRQQIIWGLGYRLASDELDNSPTVVFEPTHRGLQLFSGFLQDEIALIKDRVHLTLGSKFEHNDFTGFEIQPSGRLAWTPSDRQTVWAAISRAVRTPSRAEEDIRLDALVTNLPPPLVTRVLGNRDFKSEELVAYELGYRVQPHPRLSLDFASFYNVYDHLRSFEPGTPFPEPAAAPTHLVLPVVGGNKLDGETYGAEVAARWKVMDWWRLDAAYTFLRMQLHTEKSSGDTESEKAEGNSPQHQFSLHSAMDLPHHLNFDWTLRYVDSLPNLNIPAYVVMDVRLGWKPGKNWELAIVAQNFLDSHHPEFTSGTVGPLPQGTEVEHSVYGKVTWRY